MKQIEIHLEPLSCPSCIKRTKKAKSIRHKTKKEVVPKAN